MTGGTTRPLFSPKRRERWCFSRRAMTLLAVCAIAFIPSAAIHATTSASFFDVQVTVVRSCRISTDSLGVDRTPVGLNCATGATPQIALEPAQPGGDPVGSAAEALIASVRPTGRPGPRVPRVQPATLRLTINF